MHYFAPRIEGVMLGLAIIGLAVTALISALHLPKCSSGQPLRTLLGHLTAWILFPIVALMVSVFPSLEVQTRLMLGKDPPE